MKSGGAFVGCVVTGGIIAGGLGGLPRCFVVAVVVVLEFIKFIIIMRSAQVFNAAFLISCTQLIYDIPKYPKQ